MARKVSTVAVLGTGIMGSGMARNLARAGLETRAWNRTRANAEALADDGIAVADTFAEAVSGADAVVTMLADGDAVREVMGGDDGALAAISTDAAWLQMSTVGIAATQGLARLAAERQVAFVDAPVLGTKQPAEAGELTVLASGPDDVLDRCTPVFEAVAARTFRLGQAGNGNRMKLVVNNWLVTLTVGLAETIALAERLGMDPALFLDIIKGGPMGPAYAELKGRMMIERKFDPAFPLRLADKDARLVLEAVDGDGDELPVTRAVERRIAEAIELGHGDEDMAAAYLASAARRG
ncbi:MAG: 3-hydroxyisobutyrate dehydrogenase [Actinobacteria bacterium 13_1_20CM_3_68_9]|nr:MAG: 3-hydroxyisobutyrate dehydrogenase [Actinobacteria bacterium 13_1_20CM_3_68_9]